MIDLHAHVLPGVDDGPPDLEGALTLARAAAAGGTTVMAATPHIDFDHRVDLAGLAGRVAELNVELASAGVVLEIVGGGEVALTRAADLSAEELALVTLGTSRWLLLECPFTSELTLIDRVTERLQERAVRVLLAHPERSPALLGRLDRLAALIERGALVQITASSLTGSFGRRVRRAALAMLDAGLVHVVASDTHDAVTRSPAVLTLLARAGVDARHAEWLTHDVPRALLDDAPVPPRPALKRSRRSFIR